MKFKQSEAQTLNAIREYLQILENQGKILFIRNNSFAGRIVRKDGSQGYVKNNKRGWSDFIVWKEIIGFLSQGTSGAVGRWLGTYFIEIKSSSGKLHSDQVAFAEQVRKLGGQYHVVRAVDEVKSILGI